MLAFASRPLSKKKRVYGRNMVPPVRSRAARGAVPPGVSAETPAIRRGGKEWWEEARSAPL